MQALLEMDPEYFYERNFGDVRMSFEPFSLWLMGPTSAGKTTIALALVEYLKCAGHPVLHVDGDEVRALFGKNIGFTKEDRLRVVNACIFMMEKARQAGVSAICSALTANDDARKMLQNHTPQISTGYIFCPIEICADRDPKGLYQKAKNGEIDTLIGYNTEYKTPENPDITIDTSLMSIDDAVAKIVNFIQKEDHLKSRS